MYFDHLVARLVDMALRCLIVDDSVRFLDAARLLLEREGITVVGGATNSAEAVEQFDRLRPDVVLLDIDLGGESGFEVARRLHERAWRTSPEVDPPKIIMVSTHAEDDFAELVVESPAAGFLSKVALSARAIGTVLSGTPGRAPRCGANGSQET